jgi:hypothetical protein
MDQKNNIWLEASTRLVGRNMQTNDQDKIRPKRCQFVKTCMVQDIRAISKRKWF